MNQSRLSLASRHSATPQQASARDLPQVTAPTAPHPMLRIRPPLAAFVERSNKSTAYDKQHHHDQPVLPTSLHRTMIRNRIQKEGVQESAKVHQFFHSTQLHKASHSARHAQMAISTTTKRSLRLQASELNSLARTRVTATAAFGLPDNTLARHLSRPYHPRHLSTKTKEVLLAPDKPRVMYLLLQHSKRCHSHQKRAFIRGIDLLLRASRRPFRRQRSPNSHVNLPFVTHSLLNLFRPLHRSSRNTTCLVCGRLLQA